MKSYFKCIGAAALCLIFVIGGIGYAVDSKKKVVNKAPSKQVAKKPIEIVKSKPVVILPVPKLTENKSIKYEAVAFDKSIESADLIAKVEIVRKTKEIDKPSSETFFEAKVLNFYGGEAKVKNITTINIIQDGNSKVQVNKCPIFENKEKLILILKKAEGLANTYNIISGTLNTFIIFDAYNESYVIKEDGNDSFLNDIDVFYQELTKSRDNRKPFIFDKILKKYRASDWPQIFLEKSFDSKLTEFIKTQNSPFITNYGVKEIDNNLVNASDNFGFNIFKGELETSKNKNVIISPISLFTAFNVLGNGASGKTEEQIKGVLGTKDYTEDTLNDGMNNLINYLNRNKAWGEPGETDIYNSLWFDKTFKVKPDFINNSAKYYNSDVFNQELSTKNTVDAMNNWIDVKSRGLIKNMVTNIDKNTKLYLMNVLYFMGKWTEPFKKAATKEELFTSSKGEKLNVKMMNAERLTSYYEDEDAKVAKFNYYNGDMMVILPKGDIDNFINKLTNDDINKYNDLSKNYITKIKMPQLNIEYNCDLMSTLSKMGLPLPFDFLNAEFNNLKIDNNPLAISSVIHKCVLKLDEEGTVAAALTMMPLMGAMIPPEEKKEFYVDKPFVFVIHQYGNIVLFVGKVENPLK